MKFDIKDFHSSISRKLLDSTKLRTVARANKKRRFHAYPTRKKTTPLQPENSLAKEKHQPF